MRRTAASPAGCAYAPGLVAVPLPRGADLRRLPPGASRARLLRILLDDAPALAGGLGPARCVNLFRRPGRPRGILETHYGSDSPHRHPAVEIAAVLRGRCRFLLRDRLYRLRAGEAAIVGPEEPHNDSYDSRGAGYEILWFGLYPARHTVHAIRYEPARGPARFVRVGFASTPSASGERLREAVLGDPPDLDAVKEALLYMIERSVSALRRQAPSARHPIVQGALSILREGFPGRISVSETARRLRVTPNHLSAIFARETGTTFSRHLRDLRLGRAEEMLEDPALRLKEVAAACGFASPFHFSRLFKRRFGAAPSEYRRQHLERFA